MKDIMTEAKRYCDDTNQNGNEDVFIAFCAGAGFYVANQESIMDPLEHPEGKSNEVKISWRSNNYELEYDGKKSLQEVIMVLNQALLILVQNDKTPVDLKETYKKWLKSNQN